MAASSMSGSHSVLVDTRGRLSFPAPLRNAIGETLYISPDENFRPALVVRNEAGYIACCEKIRAEGEKHGRHYLDIDDDVRDFCANTATVVPDKNGRITLPQNLMEIAQLTSGRASILGCVTHAEIWDSAVYESHSKQYAERKKLRYQKMLEERDRWDSRPQE
jgi:MraZ protein